MQDFISWLEHGYEGNPMFSMGQDPDEANQLRDIGATIHAKRHIIAARWKMGDRFSDIFRALGFDTGSWSDETREKVREMMAPILQSVDAEREERLKGDFLAPADMSSLRKDGEDPREYIRRMYYFMQKRQADKRDAERGNVGHKAMMRRSKTHPEEFGS